MKALRLIAGVILLLASMYLGFLLIQLDPAVFFFPEVWVWLAIFLGALIAATFLIPKFCRVYLMLISAALAFGQFGSFDWVPLTLSCATLLPLAFIQPKLFRRGLLIPALSLTALSIDAFAFQHRHAIFVYSTVYELFDMDPNPTILRSPSGKTTVYVMSAGMFEPFYMVCISSGRLLPLRHGIDFMGLGGTSSSDLTTQWDGPIFLGGGKLVSFAYDERTNRIIDMKSFMQGGISINDERMKHAKNPEAFAEYLLSLPPNTKE